MISVAVSIYVLWPCTNPISFHKFPENPHGVCKKERDFDKTSLDEKLVFGRSKKEIPALRDTIFFFTSVSMLCHKSEEMSENPNWGARNSEHDNRFKANDSFSLEEELTVNIIDEPWSLSTSTKNSFKKNKVVKSPDIQNFGHSPGKSTLLFSPIVASSGTEEKCLFQKSSVTELGVANALSLVDKQHQNVQWKDRNWTFRLDSFTNRRLTFKLGKKSQGNQAWERVKTRKHERNRERYTWNFFHFN